MAIQYQKQQSAAKFVQPKGPALDKVVLDTMATISEVVGSTLGPGGRPVLLERQEAGLPPTVTKDGVTVFRSLGFTDPRAQAVYETQLDTSIRTANEAGDGTSTTAVLGYAIAKRIKDFCSDNPNLSPQLVSRRLEAAFKDEIGPALKAAARRVTRDEDGGREKLEKVATLSANGDKALAKAVMECFDLVGDGGNVTIAEVNGHSGYEVERIEGFPIAMGYEESGRLFYSKFINDPARQMSVLEKPSVVLYHGKVTDLLAVSKLLEKVAVDAEAGNRSSNVLLVATGFSEQVLGWLATMFDAQGALKVFPLLTPMFPYLNGQLDFLEDVAAVTGAEVLDQMNRPLNEAALGQLGLAAHFEAGRFRSNLVLAVTEEGAPRFETDILLRVEELETLAETAESIQDGIIFRERLGKLTGGIARLKVIGTSNGELKEKRDRAEDAVCAVRGAIKHGYLPGGGRGLLLAGDVAAKWGSKDELDARIADEILIPALEEPVRRLYENVGYSEMEVERAVDILREEDDFWRTFDLLHGEMVQAEEGGVLDSAPAVIEAVRNSISASALLGTLGGMVVFRRDEATERQLARDSANWEQMKDVNPADEHW